MVVVPLPFIARSVQRVVLGAARLSSPPARERAGGAGGELSNDLAPAPARSCRKCSSKDEGIPDDCRTLVVVPMLLATPEAIQKELDRLEIR